MISAELLGKLLQAFNISQTKLGKEIGVSQKQVSRYLYVENDISEENVIKILLYFFHLTHYRVGASLYLTRATWLTEEQKKLVCIIEDEMKRIHKEKSNLFEIELDLIDGMVSEEELNMFIDVSEYLDTLEKSKLVWIYNNIDGIKLIKSDTLDILKKIRNKDDDTMIFLRSVSEESYLYSEYFEEPYIFPEILLYMNRISGAEYLSNLNELELKKAILEKFRTSRVEEYFGSKLYYDKPIEVIELVYSITSLEAYCLCDYVLYREGKTIKYA